MTVNVLTEATRPQELALGDLACRACGARLRWSFVDLGVQPLCESYLRAEDLNRMEPHYPLHPLVCGHCWLVQVDAYVSSAEIFSEYAYFSSYSDAWVEHARRYVDTARARFGLHARSQVVEVASNDGYLLQHFVADGVPCLGIEPAANVAAAAQQRGVPTRVAFFGVETARQLRAEGYAADLLVANNVLAHVPDLHDFIDGFRALLKDDGVWTAEVQYLPTLVAGHQFDTIYHEHFCYYSLISLTAVLQEHGLRVFDVERLDTHGGSIRAYICHAQSAAHLQQPGVDALLQEERALGVDTPGYYATFAEQVSLTKRRLLRFLLDARDNGQAVVGYGAPGKGNTLLNACGIGPDLVAYTVDRNPYKQGRFLPGSRIPIHAPEHIARTRPDYVLILPWNFRDEITRQMAAIRDWGGRFVVPVPQVEVLD